MTQDDKKQEMIVRQSQLKLTLDYFNQCGVCPSTADLIKVTTMFQKFVTDGYSKDIVDSFEKIDQYIQKEYKSQ